ncbi:RIB7, arfC [Plasmopara halstedii]|uniref:RIB7, arfC n=1 Tax=Plasmopara halstedii TaxID=4781 RepID=A0A0P1ALL5_PLAHL|nr:RIB7, arfC [Plasmopara halstedii]CEG42012.1 RIB7, arfC [Plasmopara halstedii]|eukprot:XP_024578381.1 RIB7, arfC [Plasmopara halstedii]
MLDEVHPDIRRQVCMAQESWRRKCDNESLVSMPFMTLTYAQSIDGSLAVERGKPTLLSGPASMKMTHMLRTLHEGIMVGVGTILADNPSLNARLAEGLNPRPIIIDTHLRCPTNIKLFTSVTCEKPIILFGLGSQNETEELQKRKEILENLGAQVLECKIKSGRDGCDHVDLFDALRVVKQNGIQSVMVEGGSGILTSCLQTASQKHFIDLVIVTIAPTFVGGLRAVGALLSENPTTPTTALAFPRLSHPRYYVLEKDLIIVGEL